MTSNFEKFIKYCSKFIKNRQNLRSDITIFVRIDFNFHLTDSLEQICDIFLAQLLVMTQNVIFVGGFPVIRYLLNK
jgi:hypothetical protein